MKSRTTASRRWLTFSLRGLLVVLTVVCLWLGRQVERARKQREAVDAIQAVGGTIEYDWLRRGEPRRGPVWLQRLIGDEFFQGVDAVSFFNKVRNVFLTND